MEAGIDPQQRTQVIRQIIESEMLHQEQKARLDVETDPQAVQDIQAMQQRTIDVVTRWKADFKIDLSSEEDKKVLAELAKEKAAELEAQIVTFQAYLETVSSLIGKPGEL